jgi:hypothetical protein
MRRRQFITLLGGVAASTRGARAAGPVVGVLRPNRKDVLKSRRFRYFGFGLVATFSDSY